MKRIKTLLVCIDLSEYSLMTLDYAVELSKGTQREIIVFNVINQRDISAVEMVERHYPEKIKAKEYIKEMEQERHDRLKQFIKNNFFDEKSRMSIQIHTGVPFECIIKAAEKEAVDLIVMANKGRGNLSKLLFGSSAEKVFRHSPVPVVSVRDKTIFKRSL